MVLLVLNDFVASSSDSGLFVSHASIWSKYSPAMNQKEPGSLFAQSSAKAPEFSHTYEITRPRSGLRSRSVYYLPHGDRRGGACSYMTVFACGILVNTKIRVRAEQAHRCDSMSCLSAADYGVDISTTVLVRNTSIRMLVIAVMYRFGIATKSGLKT